MTAMTTMVSGTTVETEQAHAAVVLARDSREDAFRTALEPRGPEDAFKICEMVASIQLCGVQTAAEAFARISYGRSLGLSTMASLRAIYIVNNRPGIDAAVAQGICEASPECEYFQCVETTATKAVYRAKRRGNHEPQEVTWTIEDAVRAKLVDRGDNKSDNNYNKYPAQMLRARAKMDLARMLFSGLLHGLHSREELEDMARAPAAREPELVGEIVQKAAAPRDYKKEAVDLIARVRASKTKEERAAVRAAITTWDGIEPFKKEVLAEYNDAVKAAKAAAATPPAKPTAPPQDIDPETGEIVPPPKAEGRQPGED